MSMKIDMILGMAMDTDTNMDMKKMDMNVKGFCSDSNKKDSGIERRKTEKSKE